MSFHLAYRSLLIVLLVLCVPAPAQVAEQLDTDIFRSAGAQPQQPVPDLEQVEQQIVELTNQFRQQQGLEKLEVNEQLQEAAEYFAKYMARTNKYGHYADDQTPAQRAKEHGYEYCIVLENIAYRYSSAGFSAEELSQGFLQGWKESEGHRKNMLDPHVTQIGVAVAHSEESGNYFAVQMFGRPKSAAIEFQIANRSDQLIRYTVRSVNPQEQGTTGPTGGQAGNAAGQTSQQRQQASPTTQQFELPPQAIMSHYRCRPSRVHFEFMEEGESLRVEAGTTYNIQETDQGLQVQSE